MGNVRGGAAVKGNLVLGEKRIEKKGYPLEKEGGKRDNGLK